MAPGDLVVSVSGVGGEQLSTLGKVPWDTDDGCGVINRATVCLVIAIVESTFDLRTGKRVNARWALVTAPHPRSGTSQLGWRWCVTLKPVDGCPTT